MATQKKGCGFLISALVLLIVGGIIAAILGKDAVSTGKDFVKEIEKTGKSFVTPESITYAAEQDSEVTVWLAGDNTDDLSKVVIHITDTQTNKASTASKPSGTGRFGNKDLVATFTVAKGKSYEVKASGIEDGRHITIAGVSTNAALSMVGKGFGAIASFGIFGLVALILGIIGLVKFFGSKSPPAQVPPAV